MGLSWSISLALIHPPFTRYSPAMHFSFKGLGILNRIGQIITVVSRPRPCIALVLLFSLLFSFFGQRPRRTQGDFCPFFSLFVRSSVVPPSSVGPTRRPANPSSRKTGGFVPWSPPRPTYHPSPFPIKYGFRTIYETFFSLEPNLHRDSTIRDLRPFSSLDL